MQCPRCTSIDVIPKYTHGIENLFRFAIPWKSYRCLDCWRYFRVYKNVFTGKISKLALVLLIIFFAGPHLRIDDWLFRQSAFQKKIVRKISYSMPDDQTVDVRSKPLPRKVDIEDPYVSASAISISQEDVSKMSTDETPVIAGPEEKKSEMSQKSAPKTEKNNHRVASHVVLQSMRVLQPAKIETQDNSFKMTLTSDTPIDDFDYFFMESPLKLVLDLKGQWEDPEKITYSVDNYAVRRVRMGNHQDFLRIVIDLKDVEKPRPVIQASEGGLVVTLNDGSIRKES